jgi:hypothetical protein
MNGLNSFLLDSYFTLPLGSGCGKIADGSNDLALLSPNVEVWETIFVSSSVGREIYKSGETILIK